MNSSQKVIHLTTTVQKRGTITLDNLPLHAGDKVEIIIYETGSALEVRYPLRGKPVQYHEPFKSVAEDDWEAFQ